MKTRKAVVTINRGADTEVVYGQVVAETTTHVQVRAYDKAQCQFDELFAKKSKKVNTNVTE